MLGVAVVIALIGLGFMFGFFYGVEDTSRKELDMSLDVALAQIRRVLYLHRAEHLRQGYEDGTNNMESFLKELSEINRVISILEDDTFFDYYDKGEIK